MERTTDAKGLVCVRHRKIPAEARGRQARERRAPGKRKKLAALKAAPRPAPGKREHHHRHLRHPKARTEQTPSPKQNDSLSHA